MSDSSAATVASTFISVCVSRFGVPSIVTTDRVPQFEASLFTSFLKLLSTNRIRTTSNHPSFNGLAERFHRQLKAAIMGHENPPHWTVVLPVVLLGSRATLKPDIGCSSAELVYGTTFRLPDDFFEPLLIQPPIPGVTCTSSVTFSTASALHQLEPTSSGRHTCLSS
ncbi:uncharacterized protein LOC135392421 [Ornithodoros turicata]|uniref:uncharacterized protein LOC135392421 n=1 Tax=Ornithodoros turicata TaxID=34597 RepID=UPI00313A3FF1